MPLGGRKSQGQLDEVLPAEQLPQARQTRLGPLVLPKGNYLADVDSWLFAGSFSSVLVALIACSELLCAPSFMAS